MNTIRNEESPIYEVKPQTPEEDEIIRQAMNILACRMRQPGAAMDNPNIVKQYLTLQLAELEHEEFWMLFVDAQHRVIACESVFRGTLKEASIYPREVVKLALRHNAAAVILSHCHPSGHVEASTADKRLTDTLKQALNMVDVKTLDHIIVAGTETLSFAERGLL